MADFSSATVEYGPGPTSTTLLEMLKSQLDVTDDSRDDELALYLQLAGEAAERYIDNVIVLQPVNETFNRYRSAITLRYYPYIDGLTVMVDGQDMTSEFEVILKDGLDTAVKDRCGVRRDCCYKQVILTYNAGREPLPADLGFAIVQGAMGYELGGDQGGPASRESIVGVGSIEYAGASDGAAVGMGMFPGSAMAVLSAYKRWVC
ncbi:phage head-tail connector protein [Parahaliea mediterranea]|uniref:phage head-tail connector protein n=1 Tax=Parahaliea mediterranea TaxID=651086 RepID=UPI000E2FAF6D|nr:phage head-tail connector protein [Parahaliea mediterranea]